MSCGVGGYPVSYTTMSSLTPASLAPSPGIVSLPLSQRHFTPPDEPTHYGMSTSVNLVTPSQMPVSIGGESTISSCAPSLTPIEKSFSVGLSGVTTSSYCTLSLTSSKKPATFVHSSGRVTLPYSQKRVSPSEKQISVTGGESIIISHLNSLAPSQIHSVTPDAESHSRSKCTLPFLRY